MTRIQRLALVATTLTYLLIVLGAAVRVTGSGLGCPDWPLCHGRPYPPLELTAIIEYSHRTVAAFASVLILATAFSVLATRREQKSLMLTSLAVPFLLVAQIILGAITVMMELPPEVVLVHLTVALSILALLVVLTVNAHPDAASPQTTDVPQPVRRLRLLTGIDVPVVFALLMTGAWVRAAGATWACVGFPDCSGELLPFGRDPLSDIQLLHRLTAYFVVAFLIFALVTAWRARASLPAVGPAVLLIAGAGLFQLAVGVNMVSTGAPPLLRGLHVAGAAAVWVGVVLLATLARGRAETDPVPQRSGALKTVTDLAAPYIVMMKPRIIVLLLITTLAAMLIAAQGMPPIALILATLLGGATAAGAANTFNCYIDRDIDGLMTRTSQRPIPAGVVTPRQALVFGTTMGVFSMLTLGLLVNWLAAALSLIGLLYYVFVYTCLLKRKTTSNIVLGGAAGAVPPLVGWAAVTGEVSLLAVYLFAVIFFWTPPHFWALALLIRREYEKASIPMLPVVKGEAETRKQILFYSFWLVAFTLVIVVTQQVGLFYFVSALVLGGLFIYYAAKLFRNADNQSARGMFRYSMVYLAFLFFALVVDRWRI